MNISHLAQAAGVSTDTVRHYEKQGLLGAPQRQPNGYRQYTAADLERLRFVRGAQALGFSLAEIRALLPQMAQGRFGRPQIEQQLRAKIVQVDAHMAQLKALKKQLTATFNALQCPPERAVSTAQATATDTGCGEGVAAVRRRFSATAGRPSR